MLKNNLGNTIQILFNVINQVALYSIMLKDYENGYSIIAGMPLQFGLLAEKFDENTTFDEDNYSSFKNKHLIS